MEEPCLRKIRALAQNTGSRSNGGNVLGNGIPLVIFLTGAAWSDVKSGKIRNAWILPAFAAGVLYRILEIIVWISGDAGGTGSMPEAVKGMVLCAGVAILFLPFWELGGIGGGDLKELMALALLTPSADFLFCTAVSFLIAGVIAVLLRLEFGRRGKKIPFALSVFAAFLLRLGGIL